MDFQTRRRLNPTYYKCGDRFFPGHQCQPKKILAIQGNKDENEEWSLGEEDVEIEDDESEISMHALDGSTTPNTLKVKGIVGKNSMVILVDSAIIYNYLDMKIAKELGCKIVKASLLTITVANGQKMVSRAKCASFTWAMQVYTFCFNLRLLELGGYRIVFWWMDEALQSSVL